MLFLFVSSNCIAQNIDTDFEGYISYKKKLALVDKDFQPHIIVYYKKGNIRTKNLHFLTTSYYNIIKEDSIYFISEIKNTIQIMKNSSNDDNMNQNTEKNYPDSTQKILDYECVKVTSTLLSTSKRGQREISYVYYCTEKLPKMNQFWGRTYSLGCPLYILSKSKNTDTGQELTSEMIATEIVRQSLPDSLFELPKGYKRIVYPK